jgi:hypothetical protein
VSDFQQQELFEDFQSIEDSDETRVCLKCGVEKPETSFPVTRRCVTYDGSIKEFRKNTCIPCAYEQGKATRELYKHNIKPSSIVCPICDKEATGRDVVLDHDHETLEFRGWLCNKCNSALGNFYDDPKVLRKAIDYLIQ